MLWTHNTRNEVQAPAAEHGAEPFAIALPTTSFALTDIVDQNLRIEVELLFTKRGTVHATRHLLKLDGIYYYIHHSHSLSYPKRAIGTYDTPFNHLLRPDS